MGAGEASHPPADPGSCSAAGFVVAHTGANSPGDPHSAFLPHAVGSWNSLSRVWHFSFGHGAASPEAGLSMEGKSGRCRRCLRVLLPTCGATHCDRGSTNRRSDIPGFRALVERGIGKFAFGLDFQSNLGRIQWRRFLVPNATPSPSVRATRHGRSL